MFPQIDELQAQLEEMLRQDVKYDITRQEGAAVLDRVDEFYARYVCYREVDRWANVLWAAHSWLMPCWYYSPRIAYISPLSGCGKTRAMTVTEHLVPYPNRSDRMTSAAVKYAIEAQMDINGGRPTFLLDELDATFGSSRGDEELRQILDSGFEQGGFVTITDKIDGKRKAVKFPVYAPTALAGKMDIYDLPSTVRTRSVVVQMHRRAPDEIVQRWNKRTSPQEAEKLRNALMLWTEFVAAAAAEYEPDMPKELQDRDADLWEPLITVADLAGGHWPERARVTAVTHVTGFSKAPSEGELLLNDLRIVFGRHPWPSLFTEEVLAGLAAVESRWAKLSDIDLAKKLRNFGIGPKLIRRGPRVGRGYEREPLAEMWRRYPLPEPVTPVTPVTRSEGRSDER